jgi:hypothetical protein
MKFLLATLSVLICTMTTGQEVGPGTTPPDTLSVPGLFRTICLNHMPDFAGSEQQMLDSGLFLRNQRTGTIYHQTLNLSGKIQVNDGFLQCSVVFYSDENPSTVQPMLEAARDAFQIEMNQSYPNANAEIDSLTATGESTGFHRLAVFIELSQ